MNHSETIAALAAALAKETKPDEWVVVPGFASYAVHPSGLVFSTRKQQPALLIGMVISGGYRCVQLKSDAGKLERFYIHRLIASTFLPADPTRAQVNHKDGNKLNNAASNLEWCTCAENLEHARATGLSDLRGERNPMARYSRMEVDRIRTLRRAGATYKAIAEAVGCSVMQANRIARGLLRRDG